MQQQLGAIELGVDERLRIYASGLSDSANQLEQQLGYGSAASRLRQHGGGGCAYTECRTTRRPFRIEHPHAQLAQRRAQRRRRTAAIFTSALFRPSNGTALPAIQADIVQVINPEHGRR
jgi:hypothetical protein